MTDKFKLVREKLSILDICRKYIGNPVRKSGSWWIPSPFGKDKTPSCKLREDTFSFQDFSANKYGDGIYLVAQLFHLKNIDAVLKICSDFNLETGEFKPDPNIRLKQEQQELQKEKEKYFFKRKCEHFKICRKLLEGMTPEDENFAPLLLLKTQYENELLEEVNSYGK